MVKIYAHRGASAHCTENSMQAFHEAMKMGVDGIEFDVRETRDRKLIIMHDASLLKTTGIKNNVKKLDYADIQKIPLNNQESIPTFDQVLEEFGGKIFLKIELKEKGTQHLVIKTIKAHNLKYSDFILISFRPSIIRNIKKNTPQIQVEALYEMKIPPNIMIQIACRLSVSHLGPRYDLVTPKLIKLAQKKNLKITPWTVNDPEIAGKLIELGVYGITTDRPDILRL